jgi:transposase
MDKIDRLFGHAAGGSVSERLLTKLGVQASDTTILRRVKSHARRRRESEAPRVIAIDDLSWRKGSAYGTIIVDLERRKVVDVLKARSVEATANWVKQPEIEFVSRDRYGLYAQGVPMRRAPRATGR